MLGLFVINPWPNFYKKGMKTWEIRSYPTDYRGDILILNSHNNKVVCKMELVDCVPLTKELWEMNFEKHRTSCSFEDLPYRKNGKTAYAWILKNPIVYDDSIYVKRENKKPYIYLDNAIVQNKKSKKIQRTNERIACKFINDTMFLYWIKKNYFALVAIVSLMTGTTSIVLDEIKDSEVDYIVNQLDGR